MTPTSNISDGNVTVVNFKKDNPSEDTIEKWFADLLEANSRALHFRSLLLRRLQHLGNKLKADEITIDTLLLYHKFNYSIWKDEVVRLNALIQSYNTIHLYGGVHNDGS